eukprot:scaffold30171_cov41-Prasinocladus_malaysianus.AAC.2
MLVAVYQPSQATISGGLKPSCLLTSCPASAPPDPRCPCHGARRHCHGDGWPGQRPHHATAGAQWAGPRPVVEVGNYCGRVGVVTLFRGNIGSNNMIYISYAYRMGEWVNE